MPDSPPDLRALLTRSRRAVIFTGAGISTESGIPDFRSPDGVWARMGPIYFEDFLSSSESRRESWRRKLVSDREMLAAEPNRGHRVVAELVRSGMARVVITQNIDGLHQKAGVPESQVIELHGNATYASCLECGARHELEPIMRAFRVDETLPECRECHGIVKTATISFGQPMPEPALERAESEARSCDLFVAIGSSLVVYPAAALPGVAKAHGAELAILNREPTGFDRLADLVINAEIGDTLSASFPELA